MGRRRDSLGGLAAAFAGALALSLAILGVTAVVDGFATSAYEADFRARVANSTDTLARNLSDLVARETAAVDSLAAFVENRVADGSHLGEEFPMFAGALMELGQTIRSIQIAPGGILDYVYPIEGNEEALGLDLMADEDRRALLEPAIETGETVIQGPVELVQGGIGLIVRRPIYRSGAYWGFSAVVLDWPAVAELSGLASMHGDVAGVKLAGTDEVIAGSPEAFNGDPIQRELAVGGTDTNWILALRPAGGWPVRSTDTPFIWAAGVFLAGISGFFAFSLIRRPEMLRRERERVIEELEALEARYQATFENAGVGIVVADKGGTPLSVNPKFREICGIPEELSPEEIDLLSLMSEEDRRRQTAGVRRLFEGDQEVFEIEAMLQSSNTERWCQVRTSLIPGSSKRDPLVMAVVEDSTDRRRAERALASSELRYRQLFELAPIAIQREDHTAVAEEVRRIRRSGVSDIREYARQNPGWLKQLLGRVPIVDVNSAGAELQGRSGFGVVPTLINRYTEEAHSTFVESIAAIDEGRVRISQEVETRGPDGSSLYLDLRWQAPIVDGSPDYSNVMVTLADVTELRETSRRLRELIESKDRFLASVAHELRTPLTAVVGFSEELRDPGGIYSSREKAEFQELIAFHGAEMANIIDDLLVWARGDIGEVHVMPEQVDLVDSVRKTLKAMPQMDDVRLKAEQEPVFALADPARVRQIVRNLATNAMRYGGEDVEVAVRQVDGAAIVDVCDNGFEIPAPVREQMFEPYARTQGRSSQPDSIGLGLTVARTLARLQDGDLVCVREGSRNVFRLTLPQVDATDWEDGEVVGATAGVGASTGSSA